MKLKSFVTILSLGLSAAAHAETNCDAAAAQAKALKVAQSLIQIEKFPVLSLAPLTSVQENEQAFVVKNWFDTGLRVPTYTVTVSKYNCLATKIVYTDEEG